MKLEKKKEFVARTLGIGKARIKFHPEHLGIVKEALTKQDILDLVNDGAIIVKEISGRKKVEKRISRRKAGSIRKKIKGRKAHYVWLTRRLRGHLNSLRMKNEISKEAFLVLRKEIKTKAFKDRAHFKERIANIK